GLHVPNRAVLFQRDGHRAFFVGKRPAVWMVELPGHAPHIADFRLAPRERNAGLVEKGDVAVRIGRVDGRRQRFQQIAKLLFTGGVVRRVPRWSGMLGKNRLDIRTPKQIQHPSFPDLIRTKREMRQAVHRSFARRAGAPFLNATLPCRSKRKGRLREAAASSSTGLVTASSSCPRCRPFSPTSSTFSYASCSSCRERPWSCRCSSLRPYPARKQSTGRGPSRRRRRGRWWR